MGNVQYDLLMHWGYAVPIPLSFNDGVEQFASLGATAEKSSVLLTVRLLRQSSIYSLELLPKDQIFKLLKQEYLKHCILELKEKMLVKVMLSCKQYWASRSNCDLLKNDLDPCRKEVGYCVVELMNVDVPNYVAQVTIWMTCKII